MCELQNSPKPSAWDSRLRVQTSAKAYRSLRAPWGQSSHRALLERGDASAKRAAARSEPHAPRSKSVLTVSWDDEFGRLNRIALALALVAVAGHYAPPWFGVGS